MRKLLPYLYSSEVKVFHYHAAKDAIREKIDAIFSKSGRFLSEPDFDGEFTSNNTFKISVDSGAVTTGNVRFGSTLYGRIYTISGNLMTTVFKLIQALTILLLFSCTTNNKEVISTWKDGATKLERIHSDTPTVYIEREYYENGQLASETRFQNAKQNGKSISYYKEGNLLGVTYYRDGKINGEVLEYHKNGNLMFTGTQTDGELIGRAVHYYENGKPKAELFYKDNQRLVINQWDSSGKLLTGQIIK